MNAQFTVTAKQITGRKGIMGRALPDQTRFSVLYKGAEVNCFCSEADANHCAFELNAMRKDALQAFESAARDMGVAIPE
jgi:hypothetical protein